MTARPKGRVRQGGQGATKGNALVVVESPAKERTLAKMLGPGFTVKSSYGHVRDLPERKLGVDEENDFKPGYVLVPRAKKILPDLKAAAQKAREVFLATDHDREGESIAWHLVEILGLGPEKARRITFTEITPGAIREAVANPRALDMSLVQAQQARRVLDRLVGYKLSPLLWEKVQPGLSAGRVQSAAVRLIVERAAEIAAFSSEAYWTLSAKLERPGVSPPFDARLTHWKGEKAESTRVFPLFAEEYRVRLTPFRSEEQMREIASALAGASYRVSSVEAKTISRRPQPPFSTSTLQQQASQRLGYPPERTMRIAQTLYEGVPLAGGESVGLITYMRTDSFNVARVAQEEAKRYLLQEYGPAYAPPQPPVYVTKSRGAQEAHEAIRPTSVFRRPEEMKPFLDGDQVKLYDLIWKRFLSSQMSEAQFDTLTVEIGASPPGGEELARLRATGRTLKFDGFLKAYREEEEEEEDVPEPLPPLSDGDPLSLLGLHPEEHKTSPPPHYNEASLIKALEKNGIGRPSTYAPILKTIVDRGYARRGVKDKKLQPTALGTIVTEKLKAHFPEVVDLAFTAGIEELLDEVAEGRKEWHSVVRGFYQPFIKDLEEAYKGMTSAFAEPQKTEEKCPRCGSLMLLRESRFGKYLSCTRFPKCRGKVQLTPEGKPVVPEETGETCDRCGKPMVIRMGRRGRFLACSGYPECKNAFSLDADGKKIEHSRPVPTERPCGKCGSPLWLRTGKRGPFLACSAYPKCRNIVSIAREEAEKLRSGASPPPPAAPAS